MPTTLSRRALGRALLARQLLLRRSELPVTEAVEHLVGLQAQAPAPPYFALWSRLVGFSPDRLSAQITDRSVVRIVLMRGTIHLVSAADCLALRPVVAAMLERTLVGNTTYGKAKLAGLDLTAVAAAARALLEEKPRTMAELRTLLAPQWPDRDPVSLAQTARSLLPLVQVPPRGLWGTGGQPACTTAECWLGRPLDADPSPEPMVLRYLAAFGPATVRDIQAWSGLTRLAEVTDRLGSRLVRLRTEDGAPLLDVPEAPRPEADVPAPVRFLAPFDNALLSHADRSRILDDASRKVVFASVNGQIPGTVLVDGMVRGVWRMQRQGERVTLRVETMRPLSKRHVGAVTAEGNRLLRFAEPDARPELVFRPV
jgi:hypothetical protein